MVSNGKKRKLMAIDILLSPKRCQQQSKLFSDCMGFQKTLRRQHNIFTFKTVLHPPPAIGNTSF